MCDLSLTQLASMVSEEEGEQPSECADLFSQDTCEGHEGKLDGVTLCGDSVSPYDGNLDSSSSTNAISFFVVLAAMLVARI